ncbi:MAG: prsT, partial [Collimonas fungivorans]|uniref:XrtA/PEP-CTERM system TPR-repeat protein PrsT n=1 Tax=Collimonas fungivorans TaxID=158899 RepID=UPI0026E9913E
MPRSVKKWAIRASVVVTTLMLAAGLSGCGKTESSATLMAEAKQYQQKGDNKAALIQLKNAAAQNPQDAEVRFALAALYNTMGDAVSAEKEIRKAISLGGDSTRAAPVLAKALQMQGQAQKAIDETAAAAAKGDPALLAVRGDAYLALNDIAKSKESYQRALAAKAGSAESLLGLSRLAMVDKDSDGATRYVEQAIAANPKDPAVWFFNATLLRAQGKNADALAAYSQAITLKPDHMNALIERANMEIATGKFDAAKTDIDAARKAAPAALQVTYTQALLDFTQGKYGAAQESLQKVLRAAPEHLPSILLAGAVEMNLGSLQQAEQHLKKYLEKFPDNGYARKLLAQVQLKGAQPADAVATLAPLLKDSTQDAQLLALAGESAMRTRDFGKASGYFEKAALLAPNAATLHTSLGLSRLGQGDQAKGISELERATALDPKSEQAGVALVRAELALKHYDKALAAAKALVAAQPDNAVVRNLEGGVHLSKGDRAAARASFDKAVSLQPSFFAAAMNLAQMDVQDKKPDAAKQRLVAFLEKDKKNISAMTALAGLALTQNKPDEVTAWLEKANAESPEATGPAIQLATHYLRTRQPAKALTLTRKMQTANPANADLLDLMGQAQLSSNDLPGALETYGKLVNVAPKSAPAQFRLATVHLMMKNDAAAAGDLKRAIALQPGFVPAYLAQAEMALRGNRPDDALAAARQVQKLPGQEAVGLILEGDVQLQQKKPALALPLYEKAFALAKSPKLMINIHRLLAQSGKEKEAEQRLAQWSRDNPNDVMTAMYVAEGNIARKQYKAAIPQLEAILKKTPDNAAALNNLAWTYQQENDPKALETAERAYKLAGDVP